MATEIFDIDYYGRTKPDGSPYTELGDGAIGTAITRYLASSKGDYLYTPEMGGILDSFLFKPMTSDTADTIRQRLSFELEEIFSNFATGFSINVLPDFEQRTWNITISYTSLLSGKRSEVEVFAESEGSEEIKPSISIVETGEVLYNIVLTLKGYNENSGLKMVFNGELEKWVYGKYIFENLTTTDDYFTSILSFLNT